MKMTSGRDRIDRKGTESRKEWINRYNAIHVPSILLDHKPQSSTMSGIQIHSSVAQQAQKEILTEGALGFLTALHRTFESTRQSLLSARQDAQRRWDSGVPLDFPPETANIRAEASWHCAPPAPGLEDRRVEITGPTDRKMVINALNSGAKTFMADFEGIRSFELSSEVPEFRCRC